MFYKNKLNNWNVFKSTENEWSTPINIQFYMHKQIELYEDKLNNSVFVC
jgi:hypothetical protein